MLGNANRVNIGAGTSGTSDVIGATLPIDSRWDIVPGSVRVYRAITTERAWGVTTLVALDDGVGNLVGQGIYALVDGDVAYTTGVVEVRENAEPDNPFDATYHCWVEWYERFPGNTPADDFHFAFACSQSGYYPLVLHRYDHANFADKNLVNHGQWCMMARQITNYQTMYAEFLLKDATFDTDRPIMSEIAMRFGNSPGISGAGLGPRLIQRCESMTGSTRPGYRYGPQTAAGSNWYNRLNGNVAGIYVTEFNEHWTPASQIRVRCHNNYNSERQFNGIIDNTPPNILADDWHMLRMITTMDAAPGDVHIHMLMALGHAEVDAAEPVFQTDRHVWHQVGNNNPIVVNGFASVSDAVSAWFQEPHALPPTTGLQGFQVGGTAGNASDMRTYFDAFRCHRMP